MLLREYFDAHAFQSMTTEGFRDWLLARLGKPGAPAITAAEIDAWRKRIEGRGVAIEADFEWPGGGRSIYFRDPAGNVLGVWTVVEE